MPKSIVSWAVLLFSFAMILLVYKPADSGWSYSFDRMYHVPIVTMPNVAYWIMGAIAVGLSLFFVVASLRSKWRGSVEDFVNTKAYYPSFVVFISVYIIGFIKGLGAVMSISPPIWVGNLVFYYGLILFVLLVIMYFRGLPKLKSNSARRNRK